MAPARHRRAVRGVDRGAEGEQRRAAGDERGAALGDRGARDQPRGAAVDQRGADAPSTRSSRARSTSSASANSDLQNLMAATAIATVFLDRDLRITRFTPSAVELFNLIPADVGRPLSDLANRLDYPELSADAERVLEQPGADRARGRASATRWLLARLLPVPQRRGPDRRRRPDLRRHHRAAPRQRSAARVGSAVPHHRQPGGGRRRPHRSRRPDHARQRPLRPDRRPHAGGARRHVGVRPRPSRRPGEKRRGVPAHGRATARRSRWRSATCAATAASSG